MKKVSRLFFIFLFLFSYSLFAKENVSLVKRIAVLFPNISEADHLQNEIVWDQLRERLLKNQRFLVGSRKFLEQKNVFQPRGELKSVDALILAKVLDSHAIIVCFSQNRILKMIAYDGRFGFVLWKNEINLVSTLPVEHQLKSSSIKLINDFIASVPYQGHQIVDGLKGKPVYNEVERMMADVEVGLGANIDVGDKVQWIEVFGEAGQEVFGEAQSLKVIAEGEVRSVSKQRVSVEILRYKDLSLLFEGSLVHFPKEYKRLKEIYAMNNMGDLNLDVEFLRQSKDRITKNKVEQSILMTSLFYMGNLALFLVLAF